jgi:hypothetical protein
MIHIQFLHAPQLYGMPRRARIDRCSDKSFWYADRVGQVVIIERIDGYGYWSREGGEFNCINYIKPEDATILPYDS